MVFVGATSSAGRDFSNWITGHSNRDQRSWLLLHEFIVLIACRLIGSAFYAFQALFSRHQADPFSPTGVPSVDRDTGFSGCCP